MTTVSPTTTTTISSGPGPGSGDDDEVEHDNSGPGSGDDLDRDPTTPGQARPTSDDRSRQLRARVATSPSGQRYSSPMTTRRAAARAAATPDRAEPSSSACARRRPASCAPTATSPRARRASPARCSTAATTRACRGSGSSAPTGRSRRASASGKLLEAEGVPFRGERVDLRDSPAARFALVKACPPLPPRRRRDLLGAVRRRPRRPDLQHVQPRPARRRWSSGSRSRGGSCATSRAASGARARAGPYDLGTGVADVEALLEEAGPVEVALGHRRRRAPRASGSRTRARTWSTASCSRAPRSAGPATRRAGVLGLDRGPLRADEPDAARLPQRAAADDGRLRADDEDFERERVEELAAIVPRRRRSATSRRGSPPGSIDVGAATSATGLRCSPTPATPGSRSRCTSRCATHLTAACFELVEDGPMTRPDLTADGAAARERARYGVIEIMRSIGMRAFAAMSSGTFTS